MKDNGFSSWPTAKAVTGGANSQRAERGAGGPDLQEAVQNWPTPMAGTPAQNGNNAAGNNDFSRRAEELAARMWGTPRASDAEKGGPNQAFGAGGMPLPAQTANWPTPAARDGKGANGPDHLTAGTGRKHMDQLPNFVAHAFTPPDPMTWTLGAMSLPEIRLSRLLYRFATCRLSPATLRRLSKRDNYRARRLNPNFVEWLMQWPSGHALCGCSATEFARWQRHMRGALSALPTASAGWIWKEPEPEPEQMGFNL